MHLFGRSDRAAEFVALSQNETRDGSTHSTQIDVAIAVSVLGVVIVGALVWLLLREVRARHSNPKYVPGAYLKQKWRSWSPSSLRRHGQLPTDASAAGAPGMSMMQHRPGQAAGLSLEDRANRHTSVRSIASLPAYSSAPRPEEEVIAREGERGGIDTVIEFPETAEEEEARRDEEMDSLYQIRRTRREERATREEQRNQRRAARERGDLRALEELRRERLLAQVASAQNSADELAREHMAKERGRRVSSVSYAELGVARHDGSRVRADSNDSDQRPLLDAAARPGTRSRAGSSAMSLHFLNHSALSVATRAMTPDMSDDEEGRGLGSELDLTTWESMATSTTPPRTRSLTHAPEISARPSVAEGHHLPPPQYEGEGWPQNGTVEDAPPYESPTRSEAPRLAPLAILPSIQVTPFSPVLPEDEATVQRNSQQE